MHVPVDKGRRVLIAQRQECVQRYLVAAIGAGRSQDFWTPSVKGRNRLLGIIGMCMSYGVMK